MKRFLAGIAATILSLGGMIPAQAAVDEDWIPSSNADPGYHSMLIQEKTDFFRLFPRLEAWNEKKKRIVQCDSVFDSDCQNGAAFHAHYPVCGESIQADCISKFSIINNNRETMGEFQGYIYKDHVGDFVGDGKRTMKFVESPSIWSVPEEPHAYGDKYLVVVGQEGGYGPGYANSSNYADIYAIELVQTDCIDCAPKCTTEFGCGGGAIDWFKGLNCLFVSEDGLCAVHKPMPEGIKISLDLRTGSKPSGWFHGRMTDPEISIGQYGRQDVISITAAPVRVPILFLEPTFFPELPKKLQDFWQSCLFDGKHCPTGTRIAGSAENKDIWLKGETRQAESVFPPSHFRTVNAVKTFAPFVGDKAVAAPSYWSFRTLENGLSSNGCFNGQNGVLGIVTTNAVAYEDGPPKYSKGFLNYKVAGLHYLPDGTEAQGSYDLVMRSDVARCLYGFSKAPVSGTITITGTGDKTIATTTVSERNGWLKLAAYGFTFSEKTIKVKLTQKKQTSITCVATGKKNIKVTAAKPKCPKGYKKR